MPELDYEVDENGQPYSHPKVKVSRDELLSISRKLSKLKEDLLNLVHDMSMLVVKSLDESCNSEKK